MGDIFDMKILLVCRKSMILKFPETVFKKYSVVSSQTNIKLLENSKHKNTQQVRNVFALPKIVFSK